MANRRAYLVGDEQLGSYAWCIDPAGVRCDDPWAAGLAPIGLEWRAWVWFQWYWQPDDAGPLPVRDEDYFCWCPMSDSCPHNVEGYCTLCEPARLRERIALLEQERDGWEAKYQEVARELAALRATIPTCAACAQPVNPKFYYSAAPFKKDGARSKGDLCQACREKYPPI